MKMMLAVALGGAIGAVLRYRATALFVQMFGGGFPYGVLFVNVAGSFIMGVLVQLMALKITLAPEVRAMLMVGLLGALTTFSSFSLDVALLYQRGDLGAAAIYIIASVVLSVGGLFFGLWLVRVVVA